VLFISPRMHSSVVLAKFLCLLWWSIFV